MSAVLDLEVRSGHGRPRKHVFGAPLERVRRVA
jgi:hypothetical protein